MTASQAICKRNLIFAPHSTSKPKNQMIKTIFALLLVCMINIAHAQNDPKAKAILDNVSKKVKSLKSLKANFSITISGHLKELKN